MANNTIPGSGLEGIGRASDLTNFGHDQYQNRSEISTTDRISTLYNVHNRTVYHYLDGVEKGQQEWTRREVEAKSNEPTRGKRIIGSLLRTVAPIAAGSLTDAALGATGAGGPLVSAGVGAVTGAVSAGLEYHNVGEKGENAAEFWQRNVGERDRRTREGNALQRGWGHISRFLKGGKYLGAEQFGFKVKPRDEEIRSVMDSMNIQTDPNEETLRDANTVFGKLENFYALHPQEYKSFVKKMMVQSVLSNFSEQKSLIEQKQMADLFCLANAVLYKSDDEHYDTYGYSYSGYGSSSYNAPYNIPTYGSGTPSSSSYGPGYPGYPGRTGDPAAATIDELWNQATSEVKEIVAKTKTSFIVGAATERAIKSVLGFYAVKWATNGFEKIKELNEAKLQNSEDIENSKNLLNTTNSEINTTEGEIASLKGQIDGIGYTTEGGAGEILPIDYKQILEPAAKASGQDISNYLSIPERASLINDLPKISEAVQDPETLEAIMSLSKKLGKTPSEILHSGMLRWVYDKDKYGDIGDLFQQALQSDGPAAWSINQALGASEKTHTAWRDLTEAILNNPSATTGTGDKLELLQNLQGQLDDKKDLLLDLLTKRGEQRNLLDLQNNETAQILRNIQKGTQAAYTRGALLAAGVVAEVASGGEGTNYMYGEKDNPGDSNYYTTGYTTGAGNPSGHRIRRQDRDLTTTPDNANFTPERINNTVIARASMSKKMAASFIRVAANAGFDRSGWGNEARVRKNASQEYINNTTGKTTEILSDYSSKQGTLYSPTYRNSILGVASQAGPIKPECKVSIAIPALGEEAGIRHTLEQFALLNDKDKFELCILDTHQKDSADRTEEIVRDFAGQNPDLNIVYIKREVEINTNVGESRKFLNDVILERVNHLNDETKKEDHIIISHDADLRAFEHKNYVRNVIKSFERDPNLEVINGRSNPSTEALTQAPAVHAVWRTWSVFDQTVDEETNIVGKTIGSNTAIKARTLAGIGGYNPYLEIAEDLDIGWKVRNLKGDNKVGKSHSFGLEGEARRALVAHLNNIPIIHMYHRFHDNKGLRGKNSNQILAENPTAFAFDTAKYQREVQALYNHSVSKGIPEIVFEKTMRKLGITYNISNNVVSIDDSSIPNLQNIMDADKRRFQKRTSGFTTTP